jgi:endonuclease/exonuclease/phosphatase family metal-dependent hydrolase
MKFLFVPFLLISLFSDAQTAISDARKMRSGRVVTVNGIVTASFGDLSFIQDATGGIAIYGSHLRLSDSISVTGTLSRYNSMLEIVVESVVDFGFKKIVQPQLTGIGNAPDHEGELITVKNVSFNGNELFFYPKRAGFVIQENDSLQYWIEEETDIAGYSIPKQTDVTGVVGRFGSQLQLFPRSHDDIRNSLPITHYPLDISHFSVVNWNLEFFGAPRYGPSDDSLQVANVARVLDVTQPDIIALQEISNDNAFKSLLEKLPSYHGLCSSRYSFSFDTSGDFPPQKVCFVYKTSTVKVIRQKILFRELFDNNPSDLFSSGRLPYLLEIEAMGQRLALINIHAKSGVDESDFRRRLSDAQLLKDTLDTFDMPLILLGDFNDDLDQSIVIRHESPYFDFVDDAKYSCISRGLSNAGWHSTISYDDMIDHQIITSSLNEKHISTSILNPFMIPLYGRTTSDHLPVVSEFDLDKIITGVGQEQKVFLYPNPTNNNIWFPPNSDLTVINTLGEIIIQKQSAHPPISLSECARGMYFVVLNDQVFKIIRN